MSDSRIDQQKLFAAKHIEFKEIAQEFEFDKHSLDALFTFLGSLSKGIITEKKVDEDASLQELEKTFNSFANFCKLPEIKIIASQKNEIQAIIDECVEIAQEDSETSHQESLDHFKLKYNQLKSHYLFSIKVPEDLHYFYNIFIQQTLNQEIFATIVYPLFHQSETSIPVFRSILDTLKLHEDHQEILKNYEHHADHPLIKEIILDFCVRKEFQDSLNDLISAHLKNLHQSEKKDCDARLEIEFQKLNEKIKSDFTRSCDFQLNLLNEKLIRIEKYITTFISQMNEEKEMKGPVESLNLASTDVEQQYNSFNKQLSPLIEKLKNIKSEKQYRFQKEIDVVNDRLNHIQSTIQDVNATVSFFNEYKKHLEEAINHLSSEMKSISDFKENIPTDYNESFLACSKEILLRKNKIQIEMSEIIEEKINQSLPEETKLHSSIANALQEQVEDLNRYYEIKRDQFIREIEIKKIIENVSDDRLKNILASRKDQYNEIFNWNEAVKKSQQELTELEKTLNRINSDIDKELSPKPLETKEEEHVSEEEPEITESVPAYSRPRFIADIQSTDQFVDEFDSFANELKQMDVTIHSDGSLKSTTLEKESKKSEDKIIPPPSTEIKQSLFDDYGTEIRELAQVAILKESEIEIVKKNAILKIRSDFEKIQDGLNRKIASLALEILSEKSNLGKLQAPGLFNRYIWGSQKNINDYDEQKKLLDKKISLLTMDHEKYVKQLEVLRKKQAVDEMEINASYQIQYVSITDPDANKKLHEYIFSLGKGKQNLLQLVPDKINYFHAYANGIYLKPYEIDNLLTANLSERKMRIMLNSAMLVIKNLEEFANSAEVKIIEEKSASFSKRLSEITNPLTAEKQVRDLLTELTEKCQPLDLSFILKDNGSVSVDYKNSGEKARMIALTLIQACLKYLDNDREKMTAEIIHARKDLLKHFMKIIFNIKLNKLGLLNLNAACQTLKAQIEKWKIQKPLHTPTAPLQKVRFFVNPYAPTHYPITRMEDFAEKVATLANQAKKIEVLNKQLQTQPAAAEELGELAVKLTARK